MANVMILGSGGREHALAWWFRQHKHNIFTAPGNAGTAPPLGINIKESANDFDKIAYYAKRFDIKLAVVGPEEPLVNGIADYWKENRIETKLFAPTREAAKLEGSKIAARKFAEKHSIPIPKFKAFESDSNAREAKKWLEETEEPLTVVKADGLCGGKGVFVNDTAEEAARAIEHVTTKFGRNFLLEEKLAGREASITAITDGSAYKLFHHSQDHKRRYDGDTGPNTGGMGAIAPSKFITPDLEDRIKKEIIEPTITGLKEENIDYKGILYFAVMVQEDKPYLLEYNCRFGDPEAQAILPLVDADPYQLMTDCINGELRKSRLEHKHQYAACVVLVSRNYPEGKSVNETITIKPEIETHDNILTFHAGTRHENNKIVTNGGRIIGVTGLSTTNHNDALHKAYEAVKLINFKEKDYRKDIGHCIL